MLRYVVVSTTGYLSEGAGRGGSGRMPGQTWVVLDSAYCYCELAVWRSEQYVDARARAEALAAELNAEVAG